jgi:hypothetical protein
MCGALALLAASCGSSNTTPGPTGDIVTVDNGTAKGPMTGVGWIALGRDDTASDPTCSGTAITSTAPCATAISWNVTDAFCITGTIPVVVGGDYTNNWGLQIGVNANATESVPVATAYSTVALKFDGVPTTGLRLELHRTTEGASTQTYCYDGIKSEQAYKLTDFNTACWDGSGTPFTAADQATINKVGLQVSSSASAAITVTNLCLKEIIFGK